MSQLLSPLNNASHRFLTQPDICLDEMYFTGREPRISKNNNSNSIGKIVFKRNGSKYLKFTKDLWDHSQDSTQHSIQKNHFFLKKHFLQKNSQQIENIKKTLRDVGDSQKNLLQSFEYAMKQLNDTLKQHYYQQIKLEQQIKQVQEDLKKEKRSIKLILQLMQNKQQRRSNVENSEYEFIYKRDLSKKQKNRMKRSLIFQCLS